MDEEIDILDDEGQIIGKKYKKEAHINGNWHQEVHVWIYNSKGDILLQKRAKIKDTFPGLWDCSASGHVALREHPYDAAVRELEEELGIKVTKEDLEGLVIRKRVTHLPKKKYLNKGYISIFLLRFDGDISKLKLQEEEVSEVKFISPKKLLSDMKNPAERKKYVYVASSYYPDVVNWVKKRISRPSKTL